LTGAHGLTNTRPAPSPPHKIPPILQILSIQNNRGEGAPPTRTPNPGGPTKACGRPAPGAMRH